MAWYDQLLEMGAVPAGASPRSIDPYGNAVWSPVQTALTFFSKQEELRRQRAEEKRLQEEHQARMDEAANRYKTSSQYVSPKTTTGAGLSASDMSALTGAGGLSQQTLKDKLSMYKELRSAGYTPQKAYDATLKGTGLEVPGYTVAEQVAQANIGKGSEMTEIAQARQKLAEEKLNTAKETQTAKDEYKKMQEQIIKDNVIASIKSIGTSPAGKDKDAEDIWTAATKGLKSPPDRSDPDIQMALAEAEAITLAKKTPKSKGKPWWESILDWGGNAVQDITSPAMGNNQPADFTGKVSSGATYKVTKS